MDSQQELLHARKDNALLFYKDGDAKERSLLTKLFGPKPFFTTIEEWESYIIPRVNTFEDACRELGIDPEAAEFTEGSDDEIAYKKGKHVCDILNGPFLHLMKDTMSRKWYVWMEKMEAGFRFYVTVCGVSDSYTASGSRLRLCSEKLAKHFFEKFSRMMAPFWQ